MADFKTTVSNPSKHFSVKFSVDKIMTCVKVLLFQKTEKSKRFYVITKNSRNKNKMMSQLTNDKPQSKVKKVHFIWIELMSNVRK